MSNIYHCNTCKFAQVPVLDPDFKSEYFKAWNDYWVHIQLPLGKASRWNPGLFNELWSYSLSDSNVWLRPYKVKSNIWTCCALLRKACLTTWLYLLAYSTRYYWLHGNCVWLAFTSKAPFSEGVVGLSWQPNLDYHSKSMADFCQPSVLMKKPSLISTVITDRLAEIWLCQGGARDSSDELSNVFLPALLISSSPTWHDFLKSHTQQNLLT